MNHSLVIVLLFTFLDHFYSLTAKHAPNVANNHAYTHCNGIDVAFIEFCSRTGFSLDANYHVPLRMNDEATAVGFVDVDKPFAWTSSFGGTFNAYNSTLNHSDPKMKIISHYFHVEEFVMQGVIQLPGMSGCPVANGKGLTGLAHFKGNELHAAVSGVIPMHLIKGCIDNAPKTMAKLRTCRSSALDPFCKTAPLNPAYPGSAVVSITAMCTDTIVIVPSLPSMVTKHTT
jgi:hypothetical protein